MGEKTIIEQTDKNVRKMLKDRFKINIADREEIIGQEYSKEALRLCLEDIWKDFTYKGKEARMRPFQTLCKVVDDIKKREGIE